MLKNIIKLEHKIEGRDYQFLGDNDSPLAHVKEALFQFLKYVGQIEDQARAQQEMIKNEEDPKDEEKVEDGNQQQPTSGISS